MKNISDRSAILQGQSSVVSEILKAGDKNDTDEKQLCGELFHMKYLLQ